MSVSVPRITTITVDMGGAYIVESLPILSSINSSVLQLIHLGLPITDSIS